MNTDQSTFTEAEAREIDAWCAEIRAAHAIMSAPIEDGDPRLAELLELRGGYAKQLAPEDLGELYFTYSQSKPAWPLPSPVWAVTTTLLSGTYPEMVVQFEGQEWKGGRFYAQISQQYTVFVDDFIDAEGDVSFPCGDFHTSPPIIWVSENVEGLTWQDAMLLATTTRNAAVELRDYELAQ
jgi:hypothetical protein